MSWHTTPSARPADLGERLEALGLARGRDVPHMVVEIDAVPDEPSPAGPTIRPSELPAPCPAS